MNEDDILAECLEDPEVKKAGEELRDAVWAISPNNKCFGMTPIEAFQLCVEAFARMGRDKEIKTEKSKEANMTYEQHLAQKEHLNQIRAGATTCPPRMIQVKNEPPTGRRAAVEHTKRKIKDGEY